jgi:hypothetical protein
MVAAPACVFARLTLFQVKKRNPTLLTLVYVLNAALAAGYVLSPAYWMPKALPVL